MTCQICIIFQSQEDLNTHSLIQNLEPAFLGIHHSLILSGCEVYLGAFQEPQGWSWASCWCFLLKKSARMIYLKPDPTSLCLKPSIIIFLLKQEYNLSCLGSQTVNMSRQGKQDIKKSFVLNALVVCYCGTNCLQNVATWNNKCFCLTWFLRVRK